MGEDALAAGADRNVFLFFFSGHGTQVVDTSGDEGRGDRYDEAICPWDTGSTVSSVITDDELGGWLAALPANGEVVAILDTCFSGGMADAKDLSVKSIRNPAVPPQAAVRRHFGSGLAQRLAARGTEDIGGTNTVVLMACQEGGLSYETSALGNGVFSFYLVEGRSSLSAYPPADGDRDGLLSAEEEFDYASLKTTTYAKKILHVNQVPRLYDGNPAAETVLIQPPPPAVMAKFTANPTSGPAPLVVSFTDESVGVIESRSWDFGDGNTSEEQNPTHTYASPGTYTVVLTVSGPGGTDEATGSVVVERKKPPKK